MMPDTSSYMDTMLGSRVKQPTILYRGLDDSQDPGNVAVRPHLFDDHVGTRRQATA